MTASGTLPAAPAPPDRPRPDVLAYPSPTTARYLVFLAALLSAGLFVGIWVNYQLLPDDWDVVLARCELQALQQTAEPSLEGALARVNAQATCRAAFDRRLAAFAFGGAGAAGAAGLVVLYLVPGVLERRRRLRPVPPGLELASERVAALAGSVGLARPPALMLGTAAQRDGFSYGTPGRYRIALPRAVAVRWRDAALFDPLVRHELAHIAHRDVALAWLARSVWYALAPLLAIPLVIFLLPSDRLIVVVGDYLWRAALLAVVVQLVSSALLRSREHDADLRAARGMGGPEAVAAVVARARQPGAAPWYRRLRANHPPPTRRLAVLERPELVAKVAFLDGFTPAFLATLTIPLIEYVLMSFLSPAGREDLAKVAAALLAGPLLGGSVGLGLWRAALVQRVSGGPVRAAPVAFGVAAGLVAGQVASLNQTGTGNLGGVTHPPMLAVIALAGLGATALAAGLGELWADAAPVLRHSRTSWMVALATSSVVFATVLWTADSLERSLDRNGGWLATRLSLVSPLGSWLKLGAVAALAAAAAWALIASRRGAATPAWLLERGVSRPWPSTSRGVLAEAAWPAVAGGLVGAGVIIGFGVLAGPPASWAALFQRFSTYVWVAAAAGAATTLTLGLLVPRRGVGVGALAGPLASVVAMAGFLAMYIVLGGRLDAWIVTWTLRSLALGLILAVLVAPAGLLGWHQGRRPARVWPAAAALSLVAALAVVGGRDALTRNESIPLPDVGDPKQELARAEVTLYEATVTQARRRYMDATAAHVAIAADPTIDGPARAARIRAEVVTPLRALLGDAEAYQPPTSNIRSVHLALVAFLRTMTTGYETLATAHETNDNAGFAAARAKFDEGRRHASAWQAGLANMMAAAGLASGPAPTTTLPTRRRPN